MSQAVEVGELHPGELANNSIWILSLQSALSKTEPNLHAVLTAFTRVTTDRCWRHWIDDNGATIKWKASEFRSFLAAPRPRGCGSQLHVLERALRGTEAWGTYLELIRGEPGRPEINSDIVTGCFPSIPAPQGNSVSYAHRRLSRARPDLLERIKLGQLTPNAAMVEAGFRSQAITIPADPEGAARRLRRHFDGERLKQLTELLAR